MEAEARDLNARASNRPATSFEPRVILRPRTLDETLDLALAYLQHSIRDFVGIFVVLFALEALVLVSVHFASAELAKPWRFVVLAALLMSPVLERAVTVFSGRHLFGNAVTIWGSFRAVLRPSPSIAFVSFITSFPALGMIVTGFDDPTWIGVGSLFGVFWPFLLASRIHVFEVLLLEQLPFRRALDRARALVAYRYGGALGLLAVLALVRLLFVVLIQETVFFVLEVMLQFGGMRDALGYGPALAGYILAGPFIALARVFDYVDTRTRREGWDIQVRFSAIAHRAYEEKTRHGTP